MNQQEILDARYGRNPRSRRRDLIFGASVAVLATVGFFVWSIFVTQTNATTPSGKELAYEVLSPQQVKMQFSVSNGNNRTLLCDLQALDTNYGIVGQRQVEVAPGVTQDTALINTVSEAVTGVVKACWVK